MYLTKKFHLLFTLLFSFLIFNSQQVQGQQQPHYQEGQQPPLQQQQEIPEISDEKLVVFVEAVNEVNTIQLSSQREMIEVIEKYDMSVEDFNRIMQQQQNPNAEAEIEKEEMEKFSEVSKEIETIEVKTDTKAKEAIEEAGLTIDEYQNIFMAVQQSPELMQKVQKMLENN